MTALKEMAEGVSAVVAIAVLMVLALAWLTVLQHGRAVLLLVTLVGAMVLVAGGCHLVRPPAPLPHEGGTADDCKPACDNLTRLDCPGREGSPGTDGTFGTADDVSCEQACRDIVEAGREATLHQRCVMAVTTCEEADRCLAEGS